MDLANGWFGYLPIVERHKLGGRHRPVVAECRAVQVTGAPSGRTPRLLSRSFWMHSSIVGPSTCFFLSVETSAARIASAVLKSRVPVLWRGISPVVVRHAAQIGQSQSMNAPLRRAGNFSLWTLQSVEWRRKR